MLKYLLLLSLAFNISCGGTAEKAQQKPTDTIPTSDSIAPKAESIVSAKDSVGAFPLTDFTINGLPLISPYKLYDEKWGKPTSKSTEADDIGCYDGKDYKIEVYKWKAVEFVSVKDTLTFRKCKMGATTHFYIKGEEIKTFNDLKTLVLDKSSVKVYSSDSHINDKKQNEMLVYYRNDGFGEVQLHFIFINEKLSSVELWYECA